MSTIIGIIVAFAFFDWPWRGVVLGAFLLFDFLEIYVWLRWRKRRSVTGAEGIVGERGKATIDCNPEGQVRVKGQTWKALAEETLEAGDDIEVVAVSGIQLRVRKVEAGVDAHSVPR